MKTLKSPIVISNIDDRGEKSFQRNYKRSLVIERAGRKIGLIGVLAVTTKFFGITGQLEFLDEVEEVKRESYRLRFQENINIIVVLSHAGIDVDHRIAAEAGRYIDVIVGSHTHTFLYTGLNPPGPDTPFGPYPIVITPQKCHHNVLIVQASSYSKYLGNLTVYFDKIGNIQKWEGNPIFLDSSYKDDPEVKAAMQPWKDEVEKFVMREIGNITEDLNIFDCPYDECAIGNMCSDGFADFYKNESIVQKADGDILAIVIARAIRSGLKMGIITYNSLYNVMPFSMITDFVEIQGRDLLALIESGAKIYGNQFLLQVSGQYFCLKNILLLTNVLINFQV